MAAHAISPEKAAKVIAEWRTGVYSQKDLSDRHKISKGAVNKLCKGIEQDTAVIEQTRLLNFFTDAAVRNTTAALKKLEKSDEVSAFEHKALAETIWPALVVEQFNEHAKAPCSEALRGIPGG